jgi:hypothetical protein
LSEGFFSCFGHPLRLYEKPSRAKGALDDQNDDQRPINKLVPGRRGKNPASSVCASNYYSEKEPKYVADFFGRDIFFDVSST